MRHALLEEDVAPTVVVHTDKQQNCKLNRDVDKMSDDQEGQLVDGQAAVTSGVDK